MPVHQLSHDSGGEDYRATLYQQVGGDKKCVIIYSGGFL